MSRINWCITRHTVTRYEIKPWRLFLFIRMIRIIIFIFRLWRGGLGPAENGARWRRKVAGGNVATVGQTVGDSLEPDAVQVFLQMNGHAVATFVELEMDSNLVMKM